MTVFYEQKKRTYTKDKGQWLLKNYNSHKNHGHFDNMDPPAAIEIRGDTDGNV